jgi:hypothetical protein
MYMYIHLYVPSRPTHSSPEPISNTFPLSSIPLHPFNPQVFGTCTHLVLSSNWSAYVHLFFLLKKTTRKKHARYARTSEVMIRYRIGRIGFNISFPILISSGYVPWPHTSLLVFFSSTKSRVDLIKRSTSDGHDSTSQAGFEPGNVLLVIGERYI